MRVDAHISEVTQDFPRLLMFTERTHIIEVLTRNNPEIDPDQTFSICIREMLSGAGAEGKSFWHGAPACQFGRTAAYEIW